MNIQQNLAIRLLRVLRYNKARHERALALLPENKRPIFHVLPFLLHVNHPALPGFVADDDVAFGLTNYSLRESVVNSLKSVFPQQLSLFDDFRQLWPKQRLIDSLVLMGSVGTIAQSDDSDFDYWVCIDPQVVKPNARKLLQQKLQLVEQWAAQHDMEVHFFLSDIDKIRRNDFGEADGESSGSAQAVFLKAEFYTTNLVVAGKLPFWWLMPDKVNDKQYQELMNSLKPGEPPDPKLFMDFGNLQEMDSRELFGAAIWQIVKGMDSPFKSVLKMAKLEVFLENIQHKQPLCNLLKKYVHTGANPLAHQEYVDPYALMFDELIAHYQQQDNQQVVQLLQLSLYLKCGCTLSQETGDKHHSFKREMISRYVWEWGWSADKLRKIDNIASWNFSEKSLLSRQVHAFLINCYRRMSSRIAGQKQTVSQEDMTVIGRKLDTFYSKKTDKVEYLRSVFDDELYCRTVSIKADPDTMLKRNWSMYAGDQISAKASTLRNEHLKSSDNPIDLVVWAVWNRIMDSKTRIQLDYHTEPVTEEDLYKLVSKAEELFPPLRVSELPRQALLSPAKVTSCLVVLNFESRRLKPEVDTVRVIYSNSWGELYSQSGMQALEPLRRELGNDGLARLAHLLVPDGSHKQRLYDNFVMRTGLEFRHIV
ncbi:class I adenylate cyclase [Bowmanella yangjiangensis]|uniref:Class I adenylate cyclase n=1 Tax=Bowmanella yangjiangensis TaxID=2811230 RepID=A0ABS3CN49_9ALTE|nr:class I adenylate cyclase [Bowmanella yangjiangensis]MBN7818543.1 class I adenylate cyclase [Bowmanella yangjiangensis]